MPGPYRFGFAASPAAAILALAACEPAAPPGEDRGFIPGGNYVLVGMDGGTVPLRNVTMLVEEYRISGQGPCNSYSAQNNVDLPQVSLSPIVSTEMACKDSRLENRFLSVLQSATEMEYYGGVLKVKSPSTWLIFEYGVRADSGVSALDAARGSQ
ncbi:META domain-containing protein [Paracoccus siganidrum]|uniref:META domain-containing protein n=1 Tax=Paracoccus siganidrum TaxID=1276757 RepID=A0A419A7C1_9RHOB|nr:META domain-containing protein [Paracoccus siganidrum]RJL16388.1 META domain-containing protein [Paracoccus siganidrum]RMC34589.1 META domain-containing protein [Paracoccus siganidrum]